VGKGFERHVKSDQRAYEKTESIEKVALVLNTLREESGLYSSKEFENLMTVSLPYCYASGVRVLSFTTPGSFNPYRLFIVSSQNILITQIHLEPKDQNRDRLFRGCY
jgi:hypothetical protein